MLFVKFCPMLKEQLDKIQQTKRTRLHTKASLIHFIDDEEIDMHTLFCNLPIVTSFTGTKSLSFDRHTLSEKEERKFNLKFVPFLKSLIVEMDRPDINILLEYLLRVYNIDTFNPRELMFLLLPFKKYFSQLVSIAKNVKSPLSTLKVHSTGAIARIICKDVKMMRNYVEYFKNYDAICDFLDRTLDEVIDVLKAGDLEYLGEMYEILSHLIQNGKNQKVLEIYHRTRSYLNTPEFMTFWASNIPEDQIGTKKPASQCSEYELVFKNASGRDLLKNYMKLSKYLEYLSNSKQIPNEFNEAEYKVLNHIFRQTPINVSEIPPNDLFCLFKQIHPKNEIAKFIVDNGMQANCLEYFDDENKAHIINNSFSIDHFSPTNYHLLIEVLDNDIFEANYREIVEKCLSFHTFDPIYFNKFIDFDYASIFKFTDSCIYSRAYCANLLRFADKFKADLSEVFISNDFYNDPMIISYFLTSSASFTDTQIFNIVTSAKKFIQKGQSTAIVAELLLFIRRNFKKVDAKDLILWMMDNNFEQTIVSAADSFTEMQLKQLGVDILFRLFVNDAKVNMGTPSTYIFRVLESITAKHEGVAFNLIERLMESKNYSILLYIANRSSLSKVLIPHMNSVEFIEKYYVEIHDRHALAKYILDHIDDLRYLNLAVHFVDILAEFRTHLAWETAKMILIEFPLEKNQIQPILEQIIATFDVFHTNDIDLFCKLFKYGAKLTVDHIKSIINNGHAAADLINLCLYHCDDIDMLPVLPLVAPLLIKYQKDGVVKLFKRYSNIMISYVSNILQEYPTISNVLIELEPRMVLRDLCRCLNHKNIEIMAKIFKKRTCGTLDTFKRICIAFKDAIGIVVKPEHVLDFVRFLVNSSEVLGPSFEDAKALITDYLVSVYMVDPSHIYHMRVFDSLDSDTLWPFFTDCAALMAQNMFGEVYEAKNEVKEDLEFLCNFLQYGHILFDNGFKMYEQVFHLCAELSPKFIAFIIRDDPAIADACVTDLLHKINSDEERMYIMDILYEIISSLPEASLLKNKVKPAIFLLSEDKSATIAAKAHCLIEILR